MEKPEEKIETDIYTNNITKEEKVPKQIQQKHISKEDEIILENNVILQKNNVDYFFILKNYGKSASFINEIVQTEGITMYEHLKLKEIMRVN